MMRKFILALGALLSIPSACWAAFAIFQTYTPAVVPQITCNIITGVASASGPCVSPGASCNGDAQTVTRTATLANGAGGNKYLSVTVNTFVSGDVGKTIYVPGVSFAGGSRAYTTIATFTDAQNIVLTDSASGTFSSTSKAISFGTDDADSFMAFNTWARANQGSNQVVLTIPTGSNCWFGTAQASPLSLSTNQWAAGVNNLLVQGSGATLSSLGGAGFSLGAKGINCNRGLTEVTGCSARIASASAGASSVTLTSASYSAGYLSRFSVNRWIMIGGLNLQAQWLSPLGSGNPANVHFFERRQITAINSGTGEITLDRPLTNSYLDTWPEFNQGNAFEQDPGGPATIWLLNDGWNATVEYQGLTLSQAGQIYTGVRTATYRNILISGGGGLTPSQEDTFSCYTCDYTGLTIEMDKLIGTATFDGLVVNQLKTQSSSIDTMIVKNATIGNLTGSAKFTDVSDTTISGLLPGAYAYGASTRFTCTRCTVTTTFGNSSGDVPGSYAQPGISTGIYSMSGGVITFANTTAFDPELSQRIFAPIPNANLFYRIASGGAGETIGLVNGQSITQDATNMYVQTNEAGGFPTWTVSTLFGYRPHPAPQWTCDTCSGLISFASTSVQNGATPLAPLGSSTGYTYNPTTTGAAGGFFPTFGKLVSATINVTTAYNGSGSAVLNVTSQFGTPTVKQSDWSSWAWFPRVNLKQVGVRVITPGGVTCDGVPGACSGDTINSTDGYPPEAVWIRGTLTPYMANTIGAGTTPQVTISIQTDQGVVP